MVTHISSKDIDGHKHNYEGFCEEFTYPMCWVLMSMNFRYLDQNIECNKKH